MTILIMAFMILVYLRASSLRTHEEEMKKKATAAAKPADETAEDLPAQGAAEILAANWVERLDELYRSPRLKRC